MNSVPAVAAAARASTAGGIPGDVPVSGADRAATTLVAGTELGPTGSPAKAPGVSVAAPEDDRGCSMNATCRHELAVSPPVLSYD
uniref:hypothetical protein n=1 Tax=Paractinoplanes polyasparticus TaxID=2856853 RepID=UPI002108012A